MLQPAEHLNWTLALPLPDAPISRGACPIRSVLPARVDPTPTPRRGQPDDDAGSICPQSEARFACDDEGRQRVCPPDTVGAG